MSVPINPAGWCFERLVAWYKLANDELGGDDDPSGTSYECRLRYRDTAALVPRHAKESREMIHNRIQRYLPAGPKLADYHTYKRATIFHLHLEQDPC